MAPKNSLAPARPSPSTADSQPSSIWFSGKAVTPVTPKVISVTVKKETTKQVISNPPPPPPSTSTSTSKTTSKTTTTTTTRPTHHARPRTASTSSLSSLTSLDSDSDDQVLASRVAERKRKRTKNASLPRTTIVTQPLPPKKAVKPLPGAKKPRVAPRDASTPSDAPVSAVPVPTIASASASTLAPTPAPAPAPEPVPGSSRAKPRKKRKNAKAYLNDDEDDDAGGWGSGAAELLPSVYRIRSREPSANACASDDHGEFIRPERVIHTEEDGRVMENVRSSKTAVEVLTKIGRYKSGFSNLQDDEDLTFELPPHGFPVIQLQFPNTGSVEDYLMYIPKDKDHYNPLLCLELTVQTIVNELVPPELRATFGRFPEDTNFIRDLTCEEDDKSLLSLPCTRSASPMPAPSLISTSTASSGPEFRLTPDTAPFSSPASIISELTTPPDSPCRPASPALAPLDTLPVIEIQRIAPRILTSPLPTTASLLPRLRKARAAGNGPEYKRVVEEINEQLKSLKDHKSDGNLLVQPQRTWTREIPEPVAIRIIEETYQRCIAPEMKKLKKYASFSSQVYGELMPKFVSDIVKQTKLTKGMRFVDLGSGVGNVVLQTALETGCDSFGIELMEGPATLAELQHEQMRLRCRMWGIEMGGVTLKRGNMIEDECVAEWLREADVVLVNNFVFKEELNADLRPKFLDLKEGAIVVSLKPFAASSTFRLTERNIDDISAIFDVSARSYASGTVSWSSKSGNYYIHRVDRKGYHDSRIRYEEVYKGKGLRRGGRR